MFTTLAAIMTTLKCKCGSFDASFASAPRVTLICQCHSCVSIIKAIEAKDGFSGIWHLHEE
jgi:hypothetical protein